MLLGGFIGRGSVVAAFRAFSAERRIFGFGFSLSLVFLFPHTA